MRAVLLHAAVFLLLARYVPAQGVGKIIRIPTDDPYCINAKTDEVTVTLRRIITHKTGGLLTEDKKAGVTVIATLNADGSPQAKTPSVNLISVEDAPKDQVILPLEYPVASLLALSQDGGKTFTKNMLLDLYLNRVRGKNTFGTVLDTAGNLLSKLSIPANPYSNAASEVLKFANDTITAQSKDSGGQLFASVTLQFNDRAVAAAKCGDFQSTGAIAVIAAAGRKDSVPLPLADLATKYCWRYVSANGYEVQAANRPAGGCTAVAAGDFKEVPNDYVMLVVSAATLTRLGTVTSMGTHRFEDLTRSKKLCTELKMSPVLCGVY